MENSFRNHDTILNFVFLKYNAAKIIVFLKR